MAVSVDAIKDGINFFLDFCYTGSLSANTGEMLGNALYMVGYRTTFTSSWDVETVPVTVRASDGSSHYDHDYPAFTVDSGITFYGNPLYQDITFFGNPTSVSLIRSETEYIYAITGTTFNIRFDNGYQSTNRETLVFGTSPSYSNALYPGRENFNGTILAPNDETQKNDTKIVTNIPGTPSNFPSSNVIYLPIEPTETYNYYEMESIIESYIEINYPSEYDFIDWENDIHSFQDINPDATEEIETDTSSCGCGNTYITVNADGSLTLNNDISGDLSLQVDNNADISFSIAAAAGAFGAGAIVIDPEADINLNAGAFAAGAFGAGAIVSPNVSVSGSIDIGDISGSVSLDASEISISGGDINVDQSGSTVTNNYNYYYDPSEPELTEEPFTIDYDEILGESEFYDILETETYEIDTFPVETIDGLSLPDKPQEDYLPLAVQTTPDLLTAFSDLIVDTGCSSFYFPLGIFSILCYCIRGHR